MGLRQKFCRPLFEKGNGPKEEGNHEVWDLHMQATLFDIKNHLIFIIDYNIDIDTEIVTAVILPTLSIIQPCFIFQIGKTELKILWQRRQMRP